MKATYDAEADAAYVYLYDEEKVQRLGGHTVEVTPSILLDTEYGGGVLGIELLNPKPRPRLAAIAVEHGFAERLDDIYAALDMVLGVSATGAVRLTHTSAFV